jgi:hypothetical protein
VLSTHQNWNFQTRSKRAFYSLRLSKEYCLTRDAHAAERRASVNDPPLKRGLGVDPKPMLTRLSQGRKATGLRYQGEPKFALRGA